MFKNKRIISTCLAVIMIISLLPTNTLALDYNAGGDVSVGMANGSGAVWSQGQIGYRFTILDMNGTPVSNSVDYLYNQKSSNISLSIWSCKMDTDWQNHEKNRVVYVNQMYGKDGLSAKHPMPPAITWECGEVGQGVYLRDWLMNKSTVIGHQTDWVYPIVSVRPKNTVGGRHNTVSTKVVRPGNVSSNTPKIKSIDKSYLQKEINSQNKESAEYKTWANNSSKSGDTYYYKHPEAQPGPERYTKVLTSSWLHLTAGISRGLADVFSISYGANEVKTDEFPENGYIGAFLNAGDSNGFYLRLKNNEYTENVDKRYKSVTEAICDNGYYVLVEPITWLKSSGYGWVYGTVTNLAQFATTYNVAFPSTTQTLNIVGPHCLELTKDQKFKNDRVIKAPNSGNSSTVSLQDIANRDIGYAMQLYWANPPEPETEGVSRIPTFDPQCYPNPGPAPDPATIPVKSDEDTRRCKIVKTYIEYDENGDERHIDTFSRESTPFNIDIKNEGTYQVTEYFTSAVDVKTTNDTTWDEITEKTGDEPHIQFEYNSKDVKAKDSLVEQITIGKDENVLYVKLARSSSLDDSENVISQSQITKATSTDDKGMDGKGDDSTADTPWGNYVFSASIPAAQRIHIYYDEDGHAHSCGAMTRYCGDNYLCTNFTKLHGDTPLESYTTTQNCDWNGIFSPIVKNGDYENILNLLIEKTIGDSSYTWSLNQNFNSNEGIAYLTTLYRGGINDEVTIAGYKDNANSGAGIDSLQKFIPTKNTITDNWIRKDNKGYLTPLEFIFGMTNSDKNATSVCPIHGASNTKTASGVPVTISFDSTINVRVYAGENKDAASKQIGNNTKYSMDIGDGSSTETYFTSRQYKDCQLSYYPYIRMSYMTSSDNDEDSTFNSDKLMKLSGNQYQDYIKYRTVYVLSDKLSGIIPNNSVEVGWYNSNQKSGGYGLNLKSAQWSVHNRATNSTGQNDKWKGTDKVLPGGALYSLDTKDSTSILKTVTYSTYIDPESRNWIQIPDESAYTGASIVNNNNNYISQIKNTLDNLRVVQWVNKNNKLSEPWADTSSAVKISNGGESLSTLGLGTTASTDSKYRLTAGTVDNSNGALEGDLDIIKEGYSTVVYKAFTDVEGNVYVAKAYNKIGKQTLTTDELNKIVSAIKDTCGTNLQAKQPDGITAEVLKIGKKTDSLQDILDNLKSRSDTSYLFTLDAKTGLISNVVNSISRNKGMDKKCVWAKDGKWYNEAFDGMYVVQQTINYEMGIGTPNKRIAVLDPNLCPAKRSTSDVCTNAFISQFCLDSRSTSGLAANKPDRYIGTFDGMDVTLTDMEYMLKSKPFSIPNMNVQDLS